LVNTASVIAALAALLSTIVSAGIFYFREEGAVGWNVPSGTLVLVLVFSAVAIALTAAMYTLGRMARVRSFHAGELTVSAESAEGVRDSLDVGSASPAKGYDIGEGLAFLNEWSKVERKLQRLGDYVVVAKGGSLPADRLPIGAMLATLVRNDVIDAAFASDLRRVISVRNSVAHGAPVTATELEEAIRLLASVDAHLETLLPRWNRRGGPGPRPRLP
jgi:hypothetical protein